MIAGVACGIAATLARGFAGDGAVARLLTGGVAGVAVYAGLLAALAPAEARAALAAVAPAWSGRSA